MKKMTVFILILLIFSTINFQTTLAQITLEHGSGVTSVTFSPDGTILASGSRDGTVKLWNVENHENIATLGGHRDNVTSVAFSPDAILASGSRDGTVKLWNVENHENIATLEGHGWTVTSVAFSPDGTILASGAWDDTVKLWNVETHTNIATLEGHESSVYSVSFSPDGTLLASGAAGNTVKLWDVETHTNIATLGEYSRWAEGTLVAFSPDGTLLASGSDDNAVKLWDVETRTNIATLVDHYARNDVNPVAFSPDGTLLASAGSYDDTVKLWDVETQEIIATLEGHWTDVTSVAFSPDGKLLASSGYGGVKLWNIVEATRKLVKISGDEQQGTLGTALANPLVVEVRNRDNNPLPDLQVKFTVTDGLGLLSDRYTVKHVTTDANGRAAQTLTLGQAVRNSVDVSIGYQSVTFYAAGNSPAHIATLRAGDADNLISVSFSPDGTLLASGSGTAVRLWNVATHTNIATLGDHTDDVTSVAFSDDGTLLASGAADNTVKLWDVETHTNIATLEDHTDDVTSVAFSDDGALLASGAWDGIVKVWNTTTKENIATLGGHDAATLGGWFGGWFAPVSFSPDGTLLAFGGGGNINMWDVAAKENIATIEAHPEGVVSVDFSSDGTILASGSGQEIKLWDVETRENIATNLQGAEDNFFSVSFSPVGMMLAYPLYNSVVLWDVETDALIAVLRGHTDFVWSVSFLPGGTTLASGASDGTVKLWDVAEARQLTSVIPTVTPTVSISPSSMQSPAIGEQFTLSLNIANGVNVAGYQATVSFDYTALRYVESTNGDYLPADAFFGGPIIDWDYSRANLTLAANTLAGVGNGDGTLATLTFKVVSFKASTLTLSQVYLADPHGNRWKAITESGEVAEPSEPVEKIFGDINHDSMVNIQDLAIVGSRFGQRGPNGADVNGDGLVDIVDLVLVAGAFGGEAAAPSVQLQDIEMLTATEVQQWLSQAQQLALADPAYLRGIIVLEQLFAALIPKETALLANYPNPFNPETWIPYQLAKPANVTLTIYAADGQIVRRLALGHQPAGWYQTRSRAVYWDGRNEFGEPMTSGIYFYALTAGEFIATRKMLILK